MSAAYEFTRAIQAAGLTPPENMVPDGKLHRFASNGRRDDDAGWYVLHHDGIPAGVFGCWRAGIEQKWRADIGRALTPAEEAASQAKVDAMRREREAEKAREHAQARQHAEWILECAHPASAGNHYLQRKGVTPVPSLWEIAATMASEILGHAPKSRGEPLTGRLLVVPVYVGGELSTVELVDEAGHKSALYGGAKAGGYWAAQPLPEGDGQGITLLIGEGVATVLSAREATGYPVIAALSCGNLMAVAKAMRKRFPAAVLVILADLVQDTGRPDPHAMEAARAVGGREAIPDFGPNRDPSWTDFNDLAVHRGKDATGECIRRQMLVEDAAGNGVALEAKFGEDKLAAQFTELHGKDWRYVEPWGKWMLWTYSRWIAEGTRAALHLVRLVCRAAANSALTPTPAAKLASRSTVSGVESLARSDRRHAMSTDDWDRDLYLLNTLKGTIDLRTGYLHEHRREDYITKIATATSQGECPRWKSFLDEITAGNLEYQGYLQRMCGYMLTGDTSEHALFFAYGKGGNGKSVFSIVVSTILGDYATTAPMDAFMETKSERHPTDLAGLRGARLVLCSETAQGRRWDETKIKALTGGDRISARFMRQDYFQYTPQFKLLVIGNHKPGLRSVDEAVRRRLHLLPFTVVFQKTRQDKRLTEKLLLERDGILAWAIEGGLEWQIQGLNPPPCVVSATEKYFSEEDRIGQFLEEECELGVNFKVAIAALYTSWKERAEARGEYVGSAKWLVAELADRGFDRGPIPGGAKGLAGLRLKSGNESVPSPRPNAAT